MSAVDSLLLEKVGMGFASVYIKKLWKETQEVPECSQSRKGREGQPARAQGETSRCRPLNTVSSLGATHMCSLCIRM